MDKSTKLTKKQKLDTKRLKRISSCPTLDYVNKSLIKYEIQRIIYEATKKAGYQNLKKSDIKIEHPMNEKFGDFSTNIALLLTKKSKKSLDKIAESIIKNIKINNIIQDTKQTNGFINIKLKKEWLINELNNVLVDKEKYGGYKQEKPIHLIVEFGQPNTHKMPHIGHLFSFIIGESLSRITKFIGYDVFKANYQGDVGPHVAKCIWALEKYNPKTPESNKEKALLLQEMYQKGSSEYKDNKKSKEEIDDINKMIYEENQDILKSWKKTREWSINFYKEFEEKLGVNYDRYYYESEVASKGKNIVKNNIGNVFTKSKGAIIFKGSKYGLHDRVFITKNGTPTYEAKDMALQPMKHQEWPFDKMIILTAHEQNEYFGVVFKALEILDKKFKEKLMHLGFGMIKLKNGKMSSRLGNIITGINLVDQGIEAVRKIIEDKKYLSKKEKNNISDKVGIAAIKYSLLKGNPLQDITFDFDASISFDGNSGPYLQYTYTRAYSILRGIKQPIAVRLPPNTELNMEETAILRTLYRFPEVIDESAKNFAPNLLCSYLFDLAQKFNLFYKKHPVLKAENKNKRSRIAITSATAQVIKNGLNLLGIKVLEKM